LLEINFTVSADFFAQILMYLMSHLCMSALFMFSNS